MVVEISGSMILMVSATAAAIIAAAAIIEAANTYDTNAITNFGITAWDRFGHSNLTWVVITMTYPGGPLEVTGDIDLCLVAPDGATTCPSGESPEPNCEDMGLENRKHGCVEVSPAGSALKVRYEGVVNVGFDVNNGNYLGFVVRGPLHSSSWVVSVR